MRVNGVIDRGATFLSRWVGDLMDSSIYKRLFFAKTPLNLSFITDWLICSSPFDATQSIAVFNTKECNVLVKFVFRSARESFRRTFTNFFKRMVLLTKPDGGFNSLLSLFHLCTLLSH